MIRFGLLIVLLAYSALADGENNAQIRDRYAHICTVTPAFSIYGAPRNIPSSNKLARPAGKSLFADGQRLYVTGRIFDSACVPLRDAKVELWHADAQGIYRKVDAADLSSHHAVFAGAGQVKTDNRGEYLFETIMPGTQGEAPPKLHMRITHPAMRSALNTTLYVADDYRNTNDRRFRALSPAKQALLSAPLLPYGDDVNGGMRIHHDITVNARDGFRGF